MTADAASPLAGQVALVTGASRGIGRAIALHLAELGADVAVNYRGGEAAARDTATAVERAGRRALLAQADVGRPEAAAAMVDRVLATLGRVDVLVNNAGIQRSALVVKMSDDDWRDVLDVNLSGVFYLCRAVLPSMLAAGRGHIVNIASASSFVAQRGAASYVASKHGLIGLTKALALETSRKGIAVNAVAPGLTDTDLVRDLSDEQRQGLQKMVPLGRIAAPEEIARYVGFIVCSATYSTGNVFHASGGVVLG